MLHLLSSALGFALGYFARPLWEDYERCGSVGFHRVMPSIHNGFETICERDSDGP
jgi:hypothetical protein